MTQFVVLAAPGRRVDGFAAALAKFGLPPARVVSYSAFLAEPAALARTLKGADALRVDSPGGDFASWRMFASFADFDTRDFVEAVGRIDPPQPFHDGFSRALALAQGCANAGGVLQLSDAEAVQRLYDKRACHRHFRACGVPVPEALPSVGGFEALLEAIQARGLRRVFVKLRYGSGGSGVAGVELFGERVRVWTATAMEGDALYNSRRMRRHLDGDARRLIDLLAAMGVHVEQWIPKLTINGQACDLRLLMIGGEPAHAVLRLSRSPITNLHLGNRRANADVLRAHVPAVTWERILAVGRKAAAAFPAQFCLALDIAVHEDREQVFVLEGNAFGDLLYDVTHEGLDPYEYQIAKFDAWRARRAAA